MHRPHPTAVLPGLKGAIRERHPRPPSIEDHFPDTLDRLLAENEARKRQLSRRLELLTGAELECVRDGMRCLELSPDSTEDRTHQARAMRADVEAELGLRERER
jgi:hypothetical protein